MSGGVLGIDSERSFDGVERTGFNPLATPSSHSIKTLSALQLPQHPDEYRPERPILLAVDQQFGEGAALRVGPELPDPFDPLEVGEHQDAEELGGGGSQMSAANCLQACRNRCLRCSQPAPQTQIPEVPRG